MEAKKLRSAVLGVGTLVVVIGVIVGGVYGGRTVWGSPVGGKCEEDFGCSPHSICISKRCRRSCDVDADCQAGWSCRPTSVSKTSRKGFELTSVRICFSPESMAPALAREHQAEMDKKREEVRRQVDLEGIIHPLVPAPDLTAAEFDAAWSAIPEQERASGTVPQLAARTIALARPTRRVR